MSNNNEEHNENCVRVALRVRPLSTKEINERSVEVVKYVDNEPQVIIGDKDQTFTFDYVFNGKSKQEEIFDQCVYGLVDSLFEGYNSTILAYGQTGSGKTHTMGSTSTVGIDSEDLGVIPRVIDLVFDKLESKKDTHQIVLKVSFLELYNEEIRDMLNPYPAPGGLPIREKSNGEVYIPGLVEEVVRSRKQMEDALIRGSQSRTVGSTLMNIHSSRSHAIFSIIVEQTPINSPHITRTTTTPSLDGNCLPLKKDNSNDSIDGGGTTVVEEIDLDDEDMSMDERNPSIRSMFHFVDLAGSERVKKTKAEGQRLKEGININSGLLALGNVISALGDTRKLNNKAKHIPYRDSKLTRMLQSSLGGNSKTLMVACVSPADSNFEETLNTLKYAYRARNIMNKPVVNIDPVTQQIILYKAQIQLLKDTLEKCSCRDLDIHTILSQMPTTTIEIKPASLPSSNISNNNNNSNSNNSSGNSGFRPSRSSSSLSSSSATAPINRSKPNNNNSNQQQAHQHQTNNVVVNNSIDKEKEKEIFDLNMKVSQLEFENNMLEDISNKVTSKYKALANKNKQLEELAYNFINNFSPNKDQTFFNEVFEQFNSALNNTNQQQLDDQPQQDQNQNPNEGIEFFEDDSEELSDLSQYITEKEEELELISKTKHQYQQMKEQFDQKLKELESQLEEVREEKDQALKALEKDNTIGNEKVASYEDEKYRLTQFYEKKINELKSQLDQHSGSNKKDYQRLLDLKRKSEEKIDSLQQDIKDTKRQKSDLLKKMRDELKKRDDAKQHQAKELESLKREARKSGVIIDQLKNQSKKKDLLLQKKIDESESYKRKLKDIETHKQRVIQPIKPSSTKPPVSSLFSSSSSTASGTNKKPLRKSIAEPYWREWIINQIQKNLERNELQELLQKDFKNKELFVRQSNDLKKAFTSTPPKLSKAEYNEQSQFLEQNIKNQNEKISKSQTQLAIISNDCLDAPEILRMVSNTSFDKLPKLIQSALELCIEYAELNRKNQQILNNLSKSSPSPSSLLSTSNTMPPPLSQNTTNIQPIHPPISEQALEQRSSSFALMEGIKAAKLERKNSENINTNVNITNEINNKPNQLPQKQLQQLPSQPAIISETTTPQDYSSPSTSSLGQKLDQLLEEIKLDKEKREKNRLLNGYPPMNNNSSGNNNNSGFTPILVSPQPITTSSPLSSQSLPNNLNHPSKNIAPLNISSPSLLVTSLDDNILDHSVFDKDFLDTDIALDSTLKKGTLSPTHKHKKTISLQNSPIGLAEGNSSSNPGGSSINSSTGSTGSLSNDVFTRLSSQPRPDSRLKKYRDKLNIDDYLLAIKKNTHDPNENFLRCNWTFNGHDGSLLTLTLDEQNPKILYSGGSDKNIKLWDLNTGDNMMDLSSPGPVRSLCVNQSSGFMFSGGSERIVKVWDIRSPSNANLSIFKTPSDVTSLVTYGNYVVAGLENGTFKVWDIRHMQKPLKTPLTTISHHSGSIFSMSTTSKYLVTASRDHTINLFHRDSFVLAQKLQPPHHDGVTSIAVLDDVIYSGSRDKSIKKWEISSSNILNLSNTNPIETIPTNTLNNNSNSLLPQQQAQQVPPNLKTSTDTLFVSNQFQQTRLLNNAHNDWVNCLCIHNGTVFSGGKDSNIKGWDPNFTSNNLLVGHDSSITCMISSGKEFLFSGSVDKSIKIWKPSN
ncbi:hypothetical protein DICPUDRAFT_149960 [Dictyostelium purpureum]|uniref:Kinesin motor domain-containing protein n=1 Tax=Dictyostelium purpureum TaxID=5786 RepID=F0ZF38_DICPU|nr:uncharacterized protein DICPUDRAFT_149960 [Dictyostelium purpureum]EGC37470.1 hypothetical protein DICPUDRAFT_149960 [Dictyostelium purpureum]|eukprot:XP_003286034.1 hypothetical protein DICPUDRAFT_149960 [Dictyostelium purpureum]